MTLIVSVTMGAKGRAIFYGILAVGSLWNLLDFYQETVNAVKEMRAERASDKVWKEITDTTGQSEVKVD